MKHRLGSLGGSSGADMTVGNGWHPSSTLKSDMVIRRGQRGRGVAVLFELQLSAGSDASMGSDARAFMREADGRSMLWEAAVEAKGTAMADVRVSACVALYGQDTIDTTWI